MPPLQTTFNQNIPPGFVGMRANMETWNTITGLAEGDPIGYGQPVMQGTAGEQVELYDGTGIFRGITEANIVAPANTYENGQNTPVCNYGVIWVEAGGACTIRGPVGWNATTGQYSNAGTVAIPGAVFDSAATTAGELVKVRIIPSVPAAE